MNKIISIGDSIVYLIGKYLAVVAGVAVLTMMLATVYGVLMRYFVGHPQAWTYEYSEITMFAAACLAWAFVQYRRAHVRVETLVTRMKGRPRDITEVFNTLALLFYSVILTMAGYLLATDTLESGARTITLKVPLYIIQMAMVAGAFALFLQLLVHIREAIGQAIGKVK